MSTPRGRTTGFGQSPSSGRTSGNGERREKAGLDSVPATLFEREFSNGEGKRKRLFTKVIWLDALLLHFCPK